MVPGHAFHNGVVGNAVFEPDLYMPRRIRQHGNTMPYAGFVQFMQNFLAQGVVSHRADGVSFCPQLRGVIHKINGCAAGAFTGGKHIPQKFSYSDNDGFFIHVFSGRFLLLYTKKRQK